MLLHRIQLALQKRTRSAQTKKSVAWWLARGVENHPHVAFVLQSHNKSEEVLHIVGKLRQWNGKKEIIVIDDGSTTQHTARLTAGLTGVNELLLRCNDLYENITYTRAIHMARAPYVCLMQDDDTFDSLEWVDRALNLFKEHPKMAILGGLDALDVVPDESDRVLHGHVLHPEASFTLCMAVNRAPMWIARSLYMEHLHEMAEEMQPYQFDDYDLCLRAWLCGLQVGRYDARFRSLTVGGMRLYNSAFTRELYHRNGGYLYRLYRDRLDEIRQIIEKER